MAVKFLFTNNATSSLASAVTAGATTWYLNPGDGAKFPDPGANEQFNVTAVDQNGNIEVVVCTARVTDTLTVVRAQDGTTAIPFAAGDLVELRLTNQAIGNLAQRDGNLQTDLNSEKWGGGRKTISTSAPSGGNDGDVWFQYE